MPCERTHRCLVGWSAIPVRCAVLAPVVFRAHAGCIYCPWLAIAVACSACQWDIFLISVPVAVSRYVVAKTHVTISRPVVVVLALTTPARRIVTIPVAVIIGEVPLAVQTRLRLGAEVGGLALGVIFRSLAFVNTVIYGVVEFVVIFVDEAIKTFEPEFLSDYQLS